MITFSITGNLPTVNTDLTETMAKVSELLKHSVQRNFVEEGRPTAWQSLKNPVVSASNMLFDSGALFSSIRNESDANSATVTAGEGLGKYPFVHQFGSQHTVPVTPRSVGYFWWMFHNTGDEMWKRMAIVGARDKYFVVNVPARPYMMFQEEDITKIMELIGSGIVRFSRTESQGQLDALSV